MLTTKSLQTACVALAYAAVLAAGCGANQDEEAGVERDTLTCDPGKGVCFTGKGYTQLCVDDGGNCFWLVSNDGVCLSDDGSVQLCSMSDFDRTTPTETGELINCGACDDPGAAECTERASALCDELFTNGEPPSCDACRE
jgi:hypothetical protein